MEPSWTFLLGMSEILSLPLAAHEDVHPSVVQLHHLGAGEVTEVTMVTVVLITLQILRDVHEIDEVQTEDA